MDYAGQPQPLAALSLSEGSAMGVVVVGTVAYVMVQDYGFVVVNWSEPEDPQVVMDVAIPGGVRAAAAEAEALYVIDSSGQYLVFDVADPLAPVQVGDPLATAPAADIAVADGMAYLALSAGGLQIVNLTDPLHPQPVAQIALAEGNHAVAVSGPRAYVVGIGHLDHDFAAFHVVDVSDPGQPQALGDYFTDGEGFGWFDRYLDVCAVPAGIYVVHESSWYDWDAMYTYHDEYLQRFNLSDPANPLPAAPVIDALDSISGVAVGDLLAAVEYSDGPQDPWCPDCSYQDTRLVVQWGEATADDPPLFDLPLPEIASAVSWAEGYLLLAGGAAGLLVFSAPMLAPEVQGEIGDGILPPYRVSAQAAAVGGQRLATCYNHVGGCSPGDISYVVIEIYDLVDGVPVGPIDSAYLNNIAGLYDPLFVGDSHLYVGGLIFEVSESGMIDFLGYFPGSYYNHAVLSDTYLVGSTSSSLRTWDVSDPASPQLVDQMTLSAVADLAAAGNLIYAITSSVVAVVRVESDGTLTPISQVSHGFAGSAIWADGEHLAAGGTGGGLALYSISNGSDLELQGEVDLGARVADLDFGTQLYAAVSENGWAIVDVNDWAAPFVSGWLNCRRGTQAIATGDALVLVDRCPGSVLVGGEACNDLSAVAEPPIVAIPGAGLVKIEDVWPNPANPRVSVAFDLSRSARVQVELVNLMGQRVALLSDEPRSAGHHIIEWDGRWRNGREAATGVYIVRISADGKSAARKIVFVR